MYLFQIIGKPNYRQIPDKYQQKWRDNYPTLEYKIYDDTESHEFLQNHYNDVYLNAFVNGKTKWKADLLRFCLLSVYSGMYVDADMIPVSTLLNHIPVDVDFVSTLGAFCFNELNKKELHIGLLLVNSPEPLLKEFVDYMGPDVVSSGEPYSVNIAGLYSFFCKKLNVDVLEPFKVYTINNRKYYFLKEIEIHTDGKREFKIIDENNTVIINSQALKHGKFM